MIGSRWDPIMTINEYPNIIPLKNILCSRKIVDLLEKTFNKKLDDTRLRLDLLHNKKGQ